jgi:hypothetical protein
MRGFWDAFLDFHLKYFSVFLNVEVVQSKHCTTNDLLRIDAPLLFLVLIADGDYCGG